MKYTDFTAGNKYNHKTYGEVTVSDVRDDCNIEDRCLIIVLTDGQRMKASPNQFRKFVKPNKAINIDMDKSLNQLLKTGATIMDFQPNSQDKISYEDSSNNQSAKEFIQNKLISDGEYYHKAIQAYLNSIINEKSNN